MWPTEIKKSCRRIKTGLPYRKGKMILDSVIGQLSDGLWENSPRMERYWKFVCVDDDGNGNAILCVSNRYSVASPYQGRPIANGFWGRTSGEILLWFAEKIRQVAKEEEKDWEQDEFRIARGNKGISKYLGQYLTGDDVWSLRKALIEYAKSVYVI